MTTLLTPNVGIEQAIQKFGSLANMTRALNLSGYQVIQEWRRQGRVPAQYCPEIEKATGVLCETLNSKVDWAYLRNSLPDLPAPTSSSPPCAERAVAVVGREGVR